MALTRTPRILLIRPWAPSPHSALAPPMGLLYLAASVRSFWPGARIRILDLRLPGQRKARLGSLLREAEPDVVGISLMSYEARSCRALVQTIGSVSPQARIVIGGPHATAMPRATASIPGVAAAVRGEGEETFIELVERLLDQASIEEIKGITFRDADGSIRSTPMRRPIAELDALPFPAWDLVDIEGYARRPDMNGLRKARRYMGLVASRGCEYGCRYCLRALPGRYRARSPENVAEEARELAGRFGIGELQFFDDFFNSAPGRVTEICAALGREVPGMALSFPNGLRADRITEDDIRGLVAGGTYSVTYAIESASPRIQRLMGKDLDLELSERAIERSIDGGLLTKGFFMLGFPSEADQEARQTVDFACSSRLHLAGFYIVTPFPGTPLYRELHGHPEPVSESESFEMDYYSGESHPWHSITDIRGLQQRAYRRFYLDPIRIARVFRKVPRPTRFLHAAKGLREIAFSGPRDRE